MASSMKDLLAFYHDGKRDGASIIEEQLRKLDTIMDEIRRDPAAPYIRVFGSAINEPDVIPGDIDVFLDLDSMPRSHSMAHAADRLLMLSVKGSYHGNYGLLDPFVLTRSGLLLTRSHGYTQRTVIWEKVRQPRTMMAQGRKGTPVPDFRRRFWDEFHPTEQVATEEGND